MKLETLQELINEKAKKRAIEEVKILCEDFRKNDRIFEYFDGVLVHKNGEDSKTDDLRNALWNNSAWLSQRLVEHLTEEYIPIESENFIENVNRLQDEVNELFERTEN